MLVVADGEAHRVAQRGVGRVGGLVAQLVGVRVVRPSVPPDFPRLGPRAQRDAARGEVALDDTAVGRGQRDGRVSDASVVVAEDLRLRAECAVRQVERGRGCRAGGDTEPGGRVDLQKSVRRRSAKESTGAHHLTRK